MGRIGPHEDPQDAALREVRRQTGWRPESLSGLLCLQPSAGLTDSTQQVFYSRAASYVGEPATCDESQHVEWVGLDTIDDLIRRRRIVNATTVAALLLVLARGARSTV
jgi:8-oxo-dGTP pyrophosphatase MutT (NUDIX family)